MNHSNSRHDRTVIITSEEVESQLDILNRTSSQINDLENKLENYREIYRKLLSNSSNQLRKLHKRLGKCVLRSKPYYELKQKQKNLKQQLQLAALKYEEKISCVNQMRDKLTELENSVLCPGLKDLNTLESLNQCIVDFNDANKQLTQSKFDHEHLMEVYMTNEQSLHEIEKHHRFDIYRSKPYYTMYEQFVKRMEEAKSYVESCAQKLSICKVTYNETMCKLENISNCIHSMRKFRSQTDDYDSVSQNLDLTISNDSSINNNNNNNIQNSYSSSNHHSNNLTHVNIPNKITDSQSSVEKSNHIVDEHSVETKSFPLVDSLLKCVEQTTLDFKMLHNSKFLTLSDCETNEINHTSLDKLDHNLSSCSESQSSSSISRSSSFNPADDELDNHLANLTLSADRVYEFIPITHV